MMVPRQLSSDRGEQEEGGTVASNEATGNGATSNGANGNGPITVPAGLAGVVVADTTIGDVRGQEGFYHYRQYSAVEVAAARSFEDVWQLLVEGQLPDAGQGADFDRRVRALRALPDGLAKLLPQIAS